MLSMSLEQIPTLACPIRSLTRCAGSVLKTAGCRTAPRTPPVAQELKDHGDAFKHPYQKLNLQVQNLSQADLPRRSCHPVNTSLLTLSSVLCLQGTRSRYEPLGNATRLANELPGRPARAFPRRVPPHRAQPDKARPERGARARKHRLFLGKARSLTDTLHGRGPGGFSKGPCDGRNTDTREATTEPPFATGVPAGERAAG